MNKIVFQKISLKTLTESLINFDPFMIFDKIGKKRDSYRFPLFIKIRLSDDRTVFKFSAQVLVAKGLGGKIAFTEYIVFLLFFNGKRLDTRFLSILSKNVNLLMIRFASLNLIFEKPFFP